MFIVERLCGTGLHARTDDSAKLALEGHSCTGEDHLALRLSITGYPKDKEEFGAVSGALHVIQVEEGKAAIIFRQNLEKIFVGGIVRNRLVCLNIDARFGVRIELKGHGAVLSLLKLLELALSSFADTDYAEHFG